MKTSRCWGCCQENCGYKGCGCVCHEGNKSKMSYSMDKEELKEAVKNQDIDLIWSAFEYERIQASKREIFEEAVSATIEDAVREAFPDKIFDQKTAFKVFCDYHQLRCDWKIEPSPHEAWNGAVQIVAEYVVNHVILSENMNISALKAEEYKQKILDKFLEK